MQRRQVLLSSGAIAAATLAGCLGNENNANGDNPSSDDARTITVRESGEAEAEPDMAVLQTGIETTGDDADDVRDELAGRSDELYDALVDIGIDEEDITTGQFRIRQRVDHRRMEEDGVDPQSEDDVAEYTYYEGTHSFTVEVHEVEETGAVVDTAVDAGADTIGRIEFTLSEEKRETLREDALEEALESARAEADFVAEGVDATVLEAKQIDTTGGDVAPVREAVEMDDVADDAEPSTELHPDDVSVTATVSVVYEIE